MLLSNPSFKAIEAGLTPILVPIALGALVLGAILVLIAWGLSNKPKPKIIAQEEKDIANNLAAMLALGNSGFFHFLWAEGDFGDDEIGTPKFLGDRNALNEAFAKLGISKSNQPNDVLRALLDKSEEFHVALDMLRTTGSRFKIVFRGLEISGKPIGARAALIIRPLNDEMDEAQKLNAPLWRLNHEGKLSWANAAFLNAVEMKNLDEAITKNARLDARAETDGQLAITGQSLNDTRAISIGGQRRIMRVLLAPAYDGAIGAAFDVTEETTTLEIAKREAKAHVETLNHLTDAVAVFDSSRRLSTYNSAFARLWNIEEIWLDERPSHERFLDRLREKARLPHQSDFNAFKAREIAHYISTDDIADETWALPDGRTMRVMRQRQPNGGLLILFEDISDKSQLQAQYKTQLEVGRATLDKLTEGVAVFSADGKLTLANQAFFEMWDLDANFLAQNPDFSNFYRRGIGLFKDEDFWQDLDGRICDPSPDARKETQGQIELQNHTILTWLTRPLPDGATLVAFADVSAHYRMESLLREKADALAEADKLKTAFLEKVSYQLRTPLTTISGYADFLASGIAGELTPSQNEYMGAIKTASDQLEKMVGDLLDLAIIDAGQAPLDLGDVDLKEIMEQAAETAKTKLQDSQVNIEVKCDKDVGIIRADDKRIRQILANLVTNAMRNTGAGQNILINAKRFDDTIRLSVTSPKNEDDLMGQNHEFEAFSEGSKRGGMGLLLVRKFIELHGGWVALDARDKDNITIVCHLPVIAKANDAVPELELG